jgi:hypothetical protein
MLAMKVNDMRDHIIALYPDSTSWRQRVNQMSENQVIAIYKSKIGKGTEPTKSRDESEDEFPF